MRRLAARRWSAIGRATAEKRAGEDEGGGATLFVVSAQAEGGWMRSVGM